MSSPLKEAYQRPCLGICPKCGLHGAIVFKDGSQSKRIDTIKMGIELVRELVKNGTLSDDDGDRIEAHLRSSDVPADYNELASKALEMLLKGNVPLFVIKVTAGASDVDPTS